jgi:type II secretory pathway component PulJ
MMNRSNLTFLSNQEKGMSLLEVMIAVTLLAFVMFGIIEVTDNSMAAKDRTVQLNKDNLMIENAISRIEWDFSQLYSPLFFSTRSQKILDPSLNQCNNCQDLFSYYDNNPRFKFPSQDGLPVPIFASREKTDFAFLTSAHRRKSAKAKQSYFSWVQYSLGDDNDKPQAADSANTAANTGKALVRRVMPDDIFDNDQIDWENIRPSVLLSDVESLEFTFWNPQTKKYENSLTSVPMGAHLLRGVQMKIAWYDSKGNKRETTRYFRPLWTFYDAQAAAATQANPQNGTPTNPGNAAPVGTPNPPDPDEGN